MIPGLFSHCLCGVSGYADSGSSSKAYHI